MEYEVSEIGTELEKLITSCFELKINPVKVLANAVTEKHRIDSLVREALDEEICIFCKTSV